MEGNRAVSDRQRVKNTVTFQSVRREEGSGSINFSSRRLHHWGIIHLVERSSQLTRCLWAWMGQERKWVINNAGAGIGRCEEKRRPLYETNVVAVRESPLRTSFRTRKRREFAVSFWERSLSMCIQSRVHAKIQKEDIKKGLLTLAAPCRRYTRLVRIF